MVLSSLESECSSLRCLSISAVASNPFAMRILRAVRGKLRKLEARGAHVPGIEKIATDYANSTLWEIQQIAIS